eukprot:scaffold758_cov177-Amphora_coffeaeformis.AAC.4
MSVRRGRSLVSLWWKESSRCHRRCLSSTVGTNDQKKVVVALSGGVDSAVATGLLQQQGNIITEAIHMTNWNANDDDSITSCMEQDWRDAQTVAQHYGISVRHQSFEKEYWHQVFEPYLEDLSTKGWMGNPDIECNVRVKFGVLREHVQRHYGHDTWLATGHYARLWRKRDLEEWIEDSSSSLHEENAEWMWTWGRSKSRHVWNLGADEELPLLVSAVDPSKDQSYFLSGCNSQQLSRVVFPLGDYYKTQSISGSDTSTTVRQLAKDWDLPVAQKRDSVGICFIGKRKGGFRAFLRHYYEPTGPNMVDLVDVDTSEVIGVVDALTAQAATTGQGAKISGTRVKYFVVGRDDKDASKILVCAGTHHPALFADSIILGSDFSWVMPEIPGPLRSQESMRVQCRIRNLQPLVDATLHRDFLSGEYTLFLDRPFRGITPGQRAVVYLRGICLGGSTIVKAGPSYFERNLPLPNELHPAGVNDFSLQRQQESA